MLRLGLTITFFAVSLGLGIFLLNPAFQGYGDTRENVDVRSEELVNIMHYVSEMQVVRENINKYADELEMLKSVFPEDHDAPGLFFFIQNVIDKHNLEGDGIASYTVSAFEGNPRISKVSFSLDLTGGYQEIQNFLTEIERVIRIIKINNIDISYVERDIYEDVVVTSEDGFGGGTERVVTGTESVFNIFLSAHTYSR